MTNTPEPTLRMASVEQILGDERMARAAEQDRLQEIIDRLARDRSLLSAERDRLQTELQQAQSIAQRWKALQSSCNGLAEDLAEQIVVRLEDYQDDGSGRMAVCLEQDEITMDLSEDDYVPTAVIVAKSLSDVDTARFRCRLQADALRYSVEHI